MLSISIFALVPILLPSTRSTVLTIQKECISGKKSGLQSLQERRARIVRIRLQVHLGALPRRKGRGECSEVSTSISVGDGAPQLQVPAARTDGDASRPPGDLPALGDDVPVGEVVAGERERDGLRLAGVQPYGVEALQVVRRLVGGGGRRGVQLHDLPMRGEHSHP